MGGLEKHYRKIDTQTEESDSRFTKNNAVLAKNLHCNSTLFSVKNIIGFSNKHIG